MSTLKSKSTHVTPSVGSTSTALTQDKIDALARKLTGEKDTKANTLPYADPQQTERIDRANELRKLIDQAEKEYKSLKEEIMADVIAYDVPGYRTDTASFIVNTRTRTTLDKDLLLVHLPADIIASCYVEGAPYYESRVADIKS